MYNLQLPCVQPPTSSYNFQLPLGRHGHGAHVGRGEDRTGQDGTGRDWTKLTFLVTCDRQVSQFLRCLIIDCLEFLRDHLGSTGPVINTLFDHTAFEKEVGEKCLLKKIFDFHFSL